MSIEIRHLSEISEIIAGQSPPSSTYNESGDGLPFYQGKADFGEWSPVNRMWCNAPQKIANPGDILISVRAPVGPTNTATEQCCIGRGLSAIRPFGEELDSRYLIHFIRSIEAHISGKGRGSTFSSITQADLRELELPLPHKNGKPDLEEQKRIAAILDKADGIRRKRQQALRLTDDFLRAVFLDMFGDPVTNPMGFPVGVIGDLLESANYGTSKKASTEKLECPILRMGNLTYEGGWNFSDLKYITLEDKEKAKHLVHNGQLLFNRTNSRELVGKTAVFRETKPMAFAGYLVRGIAKPEADAEYISAYLNSLHGKQKLAQMCKNIVGMANINAKEMQAIPILLPPTDTQRKFGDIVRETQTKLEAWKKSIIESNDLFTSLQQRAFRGEL